jgi:hypothetical protein
MARPRKKDEFGLSPSVQRLADVITELEISKAKFAGRLGMSASGINTIFLKEGAQISKVLAKAIECEFGVSHLWLLEGVGSKWFAQYDRLRPSERWLLKHGSPEAYPSMATMVEIPMTLAILSFQGQLMHWLGKMKAYQLGADPLCQKLFDWQIEIRVRLQNEWKELREHLLVDVSDRELLAGFAGEPMPADQMKLWQTARYFFMDVTVMVDEPPPSVEAPELGIEIDQEWIDEHRESLRKVWFELRDEVAEALKKAQPNILGEQETI